MISQDELLQIICTEAIEYGGLQEIPTQKHGAKSSFHSQKRGSRGADVQSGSASESVAEPITSTLRVVIDSKGRLEWEE